MEQSLIGKIIDLPFEKFKAEIKEQKINVGVVNTLILVLENSYWNLNSRREGLLVLKGSQ